MLISGSASVASGAVGCIARVRPLCGQMQRPAWRGRRPPNARILLARRKDGLFPGLKENFNDQIRCRHSGLPYNPGQVSDSLLFVNHVHQISCAAFSPTPRPVCCRAALAWPSPACQISASTAAARRLGPSPHGLRAKTKLIGPSYCNYCARVSLLNRTHRARR